MLLTRWNNCYTVLFFEQNSIKILFDIILREESSHDYNYQFCSLTTTQHYIVSSLQHCQIDFYDVQSSNHEPGDKGRNFYYVFKTALFICISGLISVT